MDISQFCKLIVKMAQEIRLGKTLRSCKPDECLIEAIEFLSNYCFSETEIEKKIEEALEDERYPQDEIRFDHSVLVFSKIPNTNLQGVREHIQGRVCEYVCVNTDTKQCTFECAESTDPKVRSYWIADLMRISPYPKTTDQPSETVLEKLNSRVSEYGEELIMGLKRSTVNRNKDIDDPVFLVSVFIKGTYYLNE